MPETSLLRSLKDAAHFQRGAIVPGVCLEDLEQQI